MGSEDPDQNVFNHYEGMDTDDINYVHRLNHESMRNIMHQLPPGGNTMTPRRDLDQHPTFVNQLVKLPGRILILKSLWML